MSFAGAGVLALAASGAWLAACAGGCVALLGLPELPALQPAKMSAARSVAKTCWIFMLTLLEVFSWLGACSCEHSFILEHVFMICEKAWCVVRNAWCWTLQDTAENNKNVFAEKARSLRP
jgi:hypothetical protein